MNELEEVLSRMSTADQLIVATALSEQEKVIRDLLQDLGEMAEADERLNNGG